MWRLGFWRSRTAEGWRILITRRPDGVVRAGWWEWPGGKIEVGETPQQCLSREFLEELALSVAVGTPLPVIEHVYEHAHVRLHSFFCSRGERGSRNGSADASANGYEPQNRMVAEHRWVRPEDLRTYQFLEANAPLVEQVIGMLSKDADSGCL